MDAFYRIPPPHRYAGGMLVARRKASTVQVDYAVPSQEAVRCAETYFPRFNVDPVLRSRMLALYRAASTSSSLDSTRSSNDELRDAILRYISEQRLILVPAEVEEILRIRRELAWELSKAAVDAAGIVDPTPLSDGVGALMSLRDGDWVGVGGSLVSMLPYVGDALGKTAKGAHAAQKIAELTARAKELLDKLPKPRQGWTRPAEELGEAVELRAQPPRQVSTGRVGGTEPSGPPGPNEIDVKYRDGTVRRVQVGGPLEAGRTAPAEVDLAPKTGRLGAFHAQEETLSCGQACSRMVIESHQVLDYPEAALRQKSTAMGIYHPRLGTKPERIPELLRVHGVNTSELQSATIHDLERRAGSRNPAIAVMGSGPGSGGAHVVVVDGVRRMPDGSRLVQVRDPGRGPFMVEEQTFRQGFTNEAIFTER